MLQLLKASGNLYFNVTFKKYRKNCVYYKYKMKILNQLKTTRTSFFISCQDQKIAVKCGSL